MNIYAIISNGVCVNTSYWDGVTPWTPPDGTTVSRIDTLSPVPGIGWTVSGSTWTPPTPPGTTPDPVGFGVAIFSDSTIPMSTRLQLSLWTPVLEQQISDPTLVAAAWSDLCTTLSISTANQTTIANYATQFGVPGI